MRDRTPPTWDYQFTLRLPEGPGDALNALIMLYALTEAGRRPLARRFTMAQFAAFKKDVEATGLLLGDVERGPWQEAEEIASGKEDDDDDRR
jgi:hypothetical protein